MEDFDLYGLLMAGEPSAQQKAQAMADALRKKSGDAGLQRSLGNLGLLTGDKVLGQFGQAQLQGAAQLDDQVSRGQGQLGQAGQFRLSQAMAKARADQESKQFGQQLGFNRYKFGQEMGLERDKMGLSKLLAEMKAQADKQKAATEGATGLRKEFNNLGVVKQFGDVKTSFDKIKKSAENPSAAGDLGLIFGYMKMLDPTSSVRETEFANAQNAAGVPTQITNVWNRLQSGERLSPSQRQEFLKAAADYYGAHETAFMEQAGRYRGLGEKAGANPDDIIAMPQVKATAGSAQAIERNGKRYVEKNGEWYEE